MKYKGKSIPNKRIVELKKHRERSAKSHHNIILTPYQYDMYKKGELDL